MIIWKGWGILVVLIAGALAGIGGATLGSALGTDEASGIGAAGGLALAAPLVFFVGQRFNAPVAGYDPRTGQPTTFRNAHTLFFIPMQYWSILLLVLSVIVTLAVILPG